MNSNRFSLLSFFLISALLCCPSLSYASGRILFTDITNNEVGSLTNNAATRIGIINTIDTPTRIAIDPVNSKVYWTDQGTDKIYRANLDKTNIESIITESSTSDPAGIAIDSVNGKVYWTNRGATDAIKRANLDGTNIETIINAGLNNPFDIEVDPVGGKIYWVSGGANTIHRANLDGSSLQTIINVVGTGQLNISLDIANGKIYYADWIFSRISRADLDGGNLELNFLAGKVAVVAVEMDAANNRIYYMLNAGSIRRVNLDGTNDILVLGGLNTPRDLALDHTNGKIYHLDDTADLVLRVNLDGTVPETFFSSQAEDPFDVAVDEINGFLFWVDNVENKIKRSDLNGNNVQDIAVAAVNNARGLAVDRINQKVYWTSVGLQAILRVNSDGSNFGALISNATAGIITPNGIDVDEVNGKIYWVDDGTNKIQRANLDGSNVEDVITAGLSVPFGVAVDGNRGLIFWSDVFNQTINKANLDGSGVTELVGTVTLAAPRHLDLDVDTSFIYYTDTALQQIRRVAYDGTADAAIYGTNVPGLRGLAFQDTLGPTPATVISPTNASVINDNTPTINGTLTWGAFNTYEVFSNISGSLGTGVIASDSTFTFTPGSALADGTHLITIIATDGSNNIGITSSALSLTIDTVPPATPVITHPTSNFDSRDTQPYFFGTAEAYATIEVFEGATSLGTTTAAADGSWSLQSNSTLPLGTHTFSVVATDNAGNTSTAATVSSVFIEPALENPVHVFWNGFLNLKNIVSIINTDTANPLVSVARLLDMDGNELSQQVITIPEGGMLDVILNDFAGFQVDQIGLLEITFNRPTFDGSALFYRMAPNERDVEISMGAVFQDALFGASFVPFNTIQPSLNIAENSNPVYNWLQLANTDSGNSRTFTVNFYDETGSTLLSSESVSIPPKGRRDLAAGHQYGISRTGLVKIIPQDNNAPYKASLSRYGAKETLAQADNATFNFGLTLRAKQGLAVPFFVPVSAGGGGQNWLVLSNALPTTGATQVTIVSNSGEPLSSEVFFLDGYDQVHIDVSSLFSSSESGVATITPLSGAQVIAESTFYFRNATDGSITAAYATGARELFGTNNIGSFNVFLGQANFLKLFNVGGSNATITVDFYNSAGSLLGTTNTNLNPSSGREIALASYSFLPAADDVGSIHVQTSTYGGVVLELLRVRPDDNGNIDSAQSLPLR